MHAGFDLQCKLEYLLLARGVRLCIAVHACCQAALCSFVVACRRGYDVVDFAKQGAAAAIGMELVPQAVSHRHACFTYKQLV